MEKGLKKYLGKIVKIKLLEGERGFYYEGKVLAVGEVFITIDEIKEGEVDKPISKILSIKELGGEEESE